MTKNNLIPQLETFSRAWSKASVPALLLDEQSRLVGYNTAAAELFQLSIRELEGQLWAGLDAQLTVFAWKKHWGRIQDQGFVEYDTHVISGSEFLRPVSVTAFPFADANALVFLSDQLPELMVREELDQLARESGIGNWSYNRLEDQWRFSPEALRLLGETVDAPPRSMAALLDGKIGAKDLNQLNDRVKQSLADGSPFHHSMPVETPEGVAALEISGRGLGNEVHVTHLVGLIRPSGSQNALGSESDTLEKLARLGFDQTREMIFITRPDGSFAYANAAAAESLGYSRKELLQKSSSEVSGTFDVESRNAFWRMLRQEKVMEVEHTIINAEGEPVLIAAFINYFRFDDREFACSFCRNITDRSRTDFRRRLSEFTIDQSSDMILWVNESGTIRFANDTFLRRTGFPEEEVLGNDVSWFFPNSDPANRGNLWDEFREKQRLEMETELLIKQKRKTIPVRAIMNYQEFEGVSYDCLFLRSLVKKKKRDKLIELSQSALDMAADCIVWLNDKGRVEYLNRSMVNLVGGYDEQYLGEPVTELLPGIDPGNFATGSAVEFAYESPDGETHQLELKASHIEHDGRGYLVLTGRDVGERLARQNRLESAYDEIKELQEKLTQENLSLREDAKLTYNVNDIITVSPRYQKVLRQVAQVADVDTTVLILGETGTGKELLARAVHQLSDREEASLIKVNCAALPVNLIESELFGHEKGAFTGAISAKKGRFELADGGTIFLDEIGELPLDLQSKLLRVLQEGEFEKLGGTKTIRVNVRLIAATNRNLEKMVEEGTFREDLFYRLNVFPIVNLPLRERRQDIPVLAQHFARKFAKRQGKDISEIDSNDMDKLSRYDFPGNVRELENIIERSVVLCQSEVLTIDFNFRSAPKDRKATDGGKFLTFEEMQRKYIVDALKKTGGRITGPEGAGRLLDINDRTLMSKMRKLNIEKREYIV